MEFTDIISTDEGRMRLVAPTGTSVKGERLKFACKFRLIELAEPKDAVTDGREQLPASLSDAQALWDNGRRKNGRPLKPCTIGLGEEVDLTVSDGDEVVFEKLRCMVKAVKLQGVEKGARIEWWIEVDLTHEFIAFKQAEGATVTVSSFEPDLSADDLEEGGDLPPEVTPPTPKRKRSNRPVEVQPSA